MKRFLLSMSMVVVLITGCDMVMTKTVVQKVEEKAQPTAEVAEELITGVEEVAGVEVISPETAAKGEKYTEWVASGAEKAKAVVEAARPFVPEDKRPWSDLLTTILGAIGTVSVVVNGVLHRRAKKAESVAKTVVTGVDNVPGVGKAIVERALKDGNADAVEKIYRESL